MVTLETEIIGFFLFYKSNTLKRCEWTLVRWCGVSQDPISKHSRNKGQPSPDHRPETKGKKVDLEGAMASEGEAFAAIGPCSILHGLGHRCSHCLCAAAVEEAR